MRHYRILVKVYTARQGALLNNTEVETHELNLMGKKDEGPVEIEKEFLEFSRLWWDQLSSFLVWTIYKPASAGIGWERCHGVGKGGVIPCLS